MPYPLRRRKRTTAPEGAPVSGSDEPSKSQRNKAKIDQRLGAALRENLRRRKEQERARDARTPSPPVPETVPEPKDG